MGVRASTRAIAGGDDGVHSTLDAMASLITSAAQVPSVVLFARRLAVDGAGTDQVRQAAVIRAWLSLVWRFVPDPLTTELLVDAQAMLAEFGARGTVSGDCDEAAILAGSLGNAVGLGVQLVALAFVEPNPLPGPAPFSHVYAVLLTDAGVAVDCDVTAPRGPLPAIARSMSMIV